MLLARTGYERSKRSFLPAVCESSRGLLLPACYKAPSHWLQGVDLSAGRCRRANVPMWIRLNLILDWPYFITPWVVMPTRNTGKIYQETKQKTNNKRRGQKVWKIIPRYQHCNILPCDNVRYWLQRWSPTNSPELRTNTKGRKKKQKNLH